MSKHHIGKVQQKRHNLFFEEEKGEEEVVVSALCFIHCCDSHAKINLHIPSEIAKPTVLFLRLTLARLDGSWQTDFVSGLRLLFSSTLLPSTT